MADKPNVPRGEYFVLTENSGDHLAQQYDTACLMAEKRSFIESSVQFVTKWGETMPRVIYYRGKRYNPENSPG